MTASRPAVRGRGKGLLHRRPDHPGRRGSLRSRRMNSWCRWCWPRTRWSGTGELIRGPDRGARLVVLGRPRGGIDAVSTRENGHPRIAELPFDGGLQADGHVPQDDRRVRQRGDPVLRQGGRQTNCWRGAATVRRRRPTPTPARPPADGEFRQRYLAENQRLGRAGPAGDRPSRAQGTSTRRPSTPAADLLPLITELELPRPGRHRRPAPASTARSINRDGDEGPASGSG